MRSKNVILIIVLLATQIYSLTFDITQFTEVKEMNSDAYANGLIQTINTELNSKGGRIESIQQLIVELYNKLTAAQSKADKEWYERERTLNNTITDTKTLIMKLTDQLATANRKLALTNMKIHRAETNIKEYTVQYNQEAAMVVNLEMKRNMDHAIYKDNVYNHQNILMALDQVMIALRKLKGSIAGIGRPSDVKANAAEIRDTNWKKEHGGALMQIFSEEEVENFVQIATEADQDALTKLLNLLEKLRRSIAKSLADDDLIEKKSKKAYKYLSNQLKGDIEKLDEVLRKQKRNLVAYKSLRNSLKVEINEKTNIKKKNEEFLKQTVEIRRTELLKYESDKRARNREKAIIAKLQKIVNEKLAKMQEFVRSRVNQ